METNHTHPMTPFDEFTSSRQLQTLKLLLPYFPAHGQRMLGILVRFMELQNAILRFQGFPKSSLSATDSPARFLEDLSTYLSPKELQKLEQMQGLFQMLELIQNLPDSSGTENPLDMILGMLNPEQKEMFETYNAMFSDTMNQMDFSNPQGGTTYERMDESPQTKSHGSSQAGTDQTGCRTDTR